MDMIERIRMAQITAAENVVCESLYERGLVERPTSSGSVSGPNYEETRRGAAFDAVHEVAELKRARSMLSMHELRVLINTVADALLQRNTEPQTRLAAAAERYYTRYAQDEAAAVEDCVCGREQHEDAIELRDALAALRPNAQAQGKNRQ